MLSSFVISQILVFFAVLSDIASFQFKERQKILIFFVISAILVGVHYILLERYAASFLIFISAIRYSIAYFSTQKYRIYIFIAIATTSSIILFQDMLDILVYIANIIGVFVSFQKNDKSLRLLAMSGISLNIIYNIAIFSPMGVMIESIFLSSNFVGYYRYYKHKK